MNPSEFEKKLDFESAKMIGENFYTFRHGARWAREETISEIFEHFDFEKFYSHLKGHHLIENKDRNEAFIFYVLFRKWLELRFKNE